MNDQHQTPITDADWVEAFVVELRIREVSGRSIGAALAEVTSHCAESGERAQDAFGDPAIYARALNLPSGAGSGPRPIAILATASGVIGFLLALMASGAWRDGAVGFSPGHLVTGGALIALAALLALRPDAARRAVLRRPVAVPAATLAVLVAISVTAQTLWESPVVHVDWRPILVVGLGLVGAQTLYALTDHGNADAIEDPIAAGAMTPAESTRIERLLRALEPWLMVLATAIVCIPSFL